MKTKINVFDNFTAALSKKKKKKIQYIGTLGTLAMKHTSTSEYTIFSGSMTAYVLLVCYMLNPEWHLTRLG